ncbi:MAG: hypothetical protein ABIH63_04875 [archaeon]
MANNDKEKPKAMKLSEIVKQLADIDAKTADPKTIRDEYLKEGLGMGALSAGSAVGTYKSALEAAETEQERAAALVEYQKTVGQRVIPSAIMAKNSAKHIDYLDNVLELDVADNELMTVSIGQEYFNILSGRRKRR